jgi:hypothetical protein
MPDNIGRGNSWFRGLLTDPLQGSRDALPGHFLITNAIGVTAASALLAITSVEVALASNLHPQPPPNEYTIKGSGPLCFSKLDYLDPMMPYRDVTSSSSAPFSLMEDLAPLSKYLADELRRGGFDVTSEGPGCPTETLRIACHVKKRTARMGISWFPFGDRWTITWGLSCSFERGEERRLSKYYEAVGTHAYWFLAGSVRQQVAAARATEEAFPKIALLLVRDAISSFANLDSR